MGQRRTAHAWRHLSRPPDQGGDAAEQERLPLRARSDQRQTGLADRGAHRPTVDRAGRSHLVDADLSYQPPAFDRQGFTEADLIDFTPELHAQALEVAKQYVLGPMYTPPTISTPAGTKGTMMSPGAWGAGNWHTGVFDPDISHTLAAPIGVGPTAGDAEATMEYQWSFNRPAPGARPAAGTVRGLGPQVQDLPIRKSPYGRITAFNLN